MAAPSRSVQLYVREYPKMTPFCSHSAGSLHVSSIFDSASSAGLKYCGFPGAARENKIRFELILPEKVF